MGMGRTGRTRWVVLSEGEEEVEDEGESVAGPSIVALGKRRARDDSEDEDESGPSKRPRLDGDGDESGGGVEGRMVLRAPAPSLPPFSRVFSPLSGRVDEAASLRFQNARLEAANSMLQAEVERQAAQYRVALRRLVELQRERRAAQDDLLHAREVVDDMEAELARLRAHEGHGSSALRLVGLRGGAFQELADAGVQWAGEEGGSAREDLRDEGEVVGGGRPLPGNARTWADFGAQWDGGSLADEDPDVLSLRRRLGLPLAGGLTAEDLRRDVERQRRWLVARVAASRVSELGWIRRHRELLDGVAGARSFILDGLRQVQPRYRLPPQVPEGMRALEDTEETHRRISFASRRTLERVATNLGEDVPSLELAMQEQWRDMVRSLGVIEAEEAAAMEVDLTEAPEESGGVVDVRTGEAVGEGSSGRGMGMDVDG
ncbi:hypothetical protein C0992_009708 [Termitomyces sp. T32_za158]|nr:hypothetical protein C0992_009708 [Termitomyces sp. T32_za158]